MDADIAVLRDYVDWTFFFHAWELKGRFPAILDDPEKGDAARDLFAAANELLDDVVAAGSLQARGVYGFWPARAEEDDVVLDGGRPLPDAAAAGRSRRLAAEPLTRRLRGACGDRAHRPRRRVRGRDPGRRRSSPTASQAELDDYRSIMVRALADRLAEAFAEWLHEQARHEWYAPREQLSGEALIRERFRGIRPAYGYPACPDHSEKETLIDAPRGGAASGSA